MTIQVLLRHPLIASSTLIVSCGAYYSYQLVRNTMLESLKKNALLDSEDNLPFMFGDVGCGQITQCPEHKAVVTFAWACG